MKTKVYLLLAVLTLSCTFTMHSKSQQQLTVSGVVVDDQNVPLPGVTIQVKGTVQGTTTDIDGTYSIAVPSDKAVLIFSFIGYLSQEITVGNRRVIDVVLQGATTELEEMVVVGYGQQKKESVVAALSTISAVGLRQTPASNLGIALAGRLPGLTVPFRGTGRGSHGVLHQGQKHR